MSEYQYKSSNTAGNITVKVETNNEEFMKWYLTHSDEITVDVDNGLYCGDVYGYNHGLSIEESYQKISKGLEGCTLTIHGDRTATMVIAGYTFTGRV